MMMRSWDRDNSLWTNW